MLNKQEASATRPYRALGASLAWFSLLEQYWFVTDKLGLLSGTITYFCFFTICTTILVALAFTAPLLPNIPGATFFIRPGVRTAIAVYIFVVAIIFHALLRNLCNPTGLNVYVNILLHYVNPLLYVLDWAVLVPKRGLTFWQIPYWLVFPLAYALAILANGATSGFYPYPFLHAGDYGYIQITINIAGLGVFFSLVSAGFIAVGRFQASKQFFLQKELKNNF